MEKRTDERCHGDHRLWLGIGIMLAGLLFLANNFGLLDYEIRRYIFRWEVIPIVLGISFILGRSHNRTTGILLLAIGALLYSRNFIPYHFNFWQIFWPAVLIMAGFMIIFRHRLDRGNPKDQLLSTEDMIDEVAVFGGGDRVVTSQQFQGGKVTAIFGGLNYNMLKAKLAPGDNYIDVFCLFGGMKLVVPEGWTVKIRVTSLFGGFSDKHRFRVPDTNIDSGSQLIIKGTAIFGGGEIKSYFD